MPNTLEYRVESTTLINFRYKKPILSINEDGEIVSTHRKNDKGVLIKSVTLLNIIGYDDKGCIKDFEPIVEVNQFILSKHIDDNNLESGQLSQGLAHYFDFILAHQARWDKAYDVKTFDPDYDEARPSWDHFPLRKVDRLTYLYSKGLKDLVVNKQELARTTSKAYLSSVVHFYKYWMYKGTKFNNPPFEFENFNLLLEGSANSMNAHYTKLIQTTDLRLKFSKGGRSGGTPLENLRRDLKPFTKNSWSILQNILMKSRRVIRNKDSSKLHSLPIEYCLHFMICRYTGLRREEAASLHSAQIVKPEIEINSDGEEAYTKPILNLGVGDQFGSLTKTDGPGNKTRTTIIPATLMHTLYKYTQSTRYEKRLSKYQKWCEEQKTLGDTSVFEGDDAVNPSRSYLFITQTGKPMMMDLKAFTGRWVEVRDTANHTSMLDNKIVGSIHNLRSTFAVDIFSHLLKKLTPDEALARVISLLGHEDIATTIEYLKIAQDMPTADEIYEDVLDYIGAFDNLEITDGS